MNTPAITSENILEYLKQHQEKELCRFVTVGSVDDGKSTLIGRLLHDTHGIYEDQLAAVKKATKQEGGEIDFSLFTDGLKAEREQGITIDVAYRYFSTDKRKFIIADTPGHVQYTRNMATGASTANVAVILIDARLGVLPQSRRHAYIASLLGIPHLAVCVNKLDLKSYDKGVFDAISAEFTEFTRSLGFREVKFIPISAKLGDNVVHVSTNMPWYPGVAAGGGTLLEYLETVPVDAGINRKDFRFPVQYVIRPNLDYRGFAGTIASGSVKKGDIVTSLPSGKKSKVVAIDSFDGELDVAYAPQAVTLRLADEIDTSRGDMFVLESSIPPVAERFEANLVWMSEAALDPSRTYLVKHTTQTVRADVESVQFIVDLETLEKKSAAHLELNDIGRVTFAVHKPLFVDPYRENHATGAFIVIDPLTNNTVAAGMIESALSGVASKSHADLPTSKVTREEHEARLGQKGAAIFFTGLPGAGKSEIAYELERQLFDAGKVALVVDPDDRLGRSVAADGSMPLSTPEIARRLTRASVFSIFSFAAPHAGERDALRNALALKRALEVYVATPLVECKRRSLRGTYDEVHFEPRYDVPRNPDITVSLTDGETPGTAAAKVLAILRERGLLEA